MLTNNNQYFYENNPAQNKKNFNNYGGNTGVAATLLEEANDDDFWYQAPKNGQNDTVGASGEYQGYVKSNNPGSSNGRVGSRKGGIVPGGGRPF